MRSRAIAGVRNFARVINLWHWSIRAPGPSTCPAKGWDADTAIEEMFDFRYNPVWFGNPHFLRRLAARRDEVAERARRAR